MYAATEKTADIEITATTKVNSSPLSWLAPKTEAEKKIISDNMKERQQRIGMDMLSDLWRSMENGMQF